MATRVEYIVSLKDKFSKGIKDADSSASKFETRMGGLAKSMIGMAAIYGAFNLGKKFVMAASDAEETAAKFDTVFKDISQGAIKVAEDLSTNYGLSSKASKQLLSDTGDLLTGFGFTGNQALGLSEEVNKLAVDLASFTNFEGGAEGASQALTKALLGERESVKSLGIAILDSDVKARVKQMESMGKLIGLTERQKKAYATLDIAQSQSKNAIGDFKRTQDGFANRWRVLEGAMDDASVAMGKGTMSAINKLLPGVTSLTRKFTRLISVKVSDTLNDQRKKLIDLQIQINSNNITEADRLKLFEEIKKINPDIVAGLDAENIAYTKLNKKIEAYNEKLIDQIMVQKMSEKIDAYKTDIVDKRREEYAQARQDVRDEIVAYSDALKELGGAQENATNKILSAQTYANGTAITQASKLLMLRRLGEANDISGYDATAALFKLDESKKWMAKFQSDLDSQISKRDALKRELGIVDESLTNQISPIDPVDPTNMDKLKDLTTSVTAAAPKIFNINIDKLVDTFNVSAATISEGTSEVKDKIIEAFLGAINDVQIIAN